MALLEPRFRTLFGVLFGVFTLFGTSMTIVGATLPRILADFHWDYVTAGAVIAAGAVAYFLSAFAAGSLVKLWGPKVTILTGLALDIVGLSFFGAVADPVTNFLLSFLIGLGQGCFEVAVNWSALRIDTFKTGRPMNIMHGAFAVGAIVGPFVLGILMGAGGEWTLLYRGMAVLFGVLALVLLWVPMALTAEPEPEGAADQPRVRLSVSPAYWLAFFALFLYVGVELGVSNWVAEYFVQVFRFAPASSSFLVSLFWAGVLAGRFGVPVLLKNAHPDRLLIGFSILATVATLALPVLSLASDQALAPAAGVVLVFLSGLGCSVVYPLVMTLVGLCFPQHQSRVVGFAATGGGVGAFLFPFVMSALSQAWGIRWGFATYGAFSLLMLAVTFALTLAGAKQRKA
jgi:fucose permease